MTAYQGSKVPLSGTLVRHLVYTGPGFAYMQAASLTNLHVENLTITGFDIQGAASLLGRNGQLNDCILDVSQKEIDFFDTQKLGFSRCRLPPHTWKELAFTG